jgi:hypothetical protein
MQLMLSLTIIKIDASAQTIVNDSYIDRAVDGIQRAAAAGADVSALTDKFNVGLDFLYQAQDADFRMCSYSEDCKARANEIFASISKESAILMEHSQAASNYRSIMTYGLLVPSIAFATSLSIVCLFKVWKSYQIKRFLDMEISEKED